MYIKKSDGYVDDGMFELFEEIIESQTKYNTENSIGAIPIVIYYSVDHILEKIIIYLRII